MTETKTFDPADGIVDFDAGEGEAATVVEMDDYTKSLAQAKAKSVKLVDAITGQTLKKKMPCTSTTSAPRWRISCG